MQDKPKSNSVVTSKWDDAGQVLIIEVIGAGQVRFHPHKAHRNNRDYAEIHGWTQRLSNATAIAKEKNPTAQMKFEAVARLRDHYESGAEDWDLTARPRGPQFDQWVVRAVAALKGIDYGAALELALKAANERKATVVDVVKVWGAIKAVGDKAAELRSAASGITLDQVAEMEAELDIKGE